MAVLKLRMPKGKSDIGHAINNMANAVGTSNSTTQATGNPGTPNAADTQQAVGAAGGLLSALGHSLGAHRHGPGGFPRFCGSAAASLSGMQQGHAKGRGEAPRWA